MYLHLTNCSDSISSQVFVRWATPDFSMLTTSYLLVSEMSSSSSSSESWQEAKASTLKADLMPGAFGFAVFMSLYIEFISIHLIDLTLGLLATRGALLARSAKRLSYRIFV